MVSRETLTEDVTAPASFRPFHAKILVGLCTVVIAVSSALFAFFDPEDGGDMILRNVGCNSTDYTASYPRR
jgi:hypothetical protein